MSIGKRGGHKGGCCESGTSYDHSYKQSNGCNEINFAGFGAYSGGKIVRTERIRCLGFL